LSNRIPERSLMKTRILTVLAIFLLLATVAQAAEVTLQWDASTSADVTGYRIYQSDQSGQYNRATQRAAETTRDTLTATIVVPVEDGRRVYFVATAFDAAGNESGYSNECVWTVPDHTAPAPPPMLRAVERIAAALEQLVNGGLRVRTE
jgi:hypothetical protein